MSLETSDPATFSPGPVPAERLLAAADAALMGLWDADVATGEAMWSAGMFALLGLDPATTRAHVDAWRARIHPDDLAEVMAAYGRGREGNGLFAATHRIVRADTGAVRWVGARGRIVRGTPDRFTGALVDVTDRRREEERLRESEARFREAFEHAPIGMALTEPGTGRLLYVNRAYADIVGYTREELASLDFLAITHEDDRAHNREVYRQLFAGEIPAFRIEKRYIRKDGRAVWVRASGSLQRDAEGRPFRAVGLIEDIEERRRAADRVEDDARERTRLLDALRRELAEREQAEREFRMLAETVPDLVFTTRPDGRLEWYNSRTAEFCGRPWSPESAEQWRMDVHPDDVEGVVARWRRSMETGEPYESEARWRRVDGAWRWMLNRALPLRGDDGAIRLWVGTGTDVHERREAAERAATLQRVTAALASAVDVASVARVLVAEGVRAFGARLGGLWLPSADGTALDRVEAAALSDATRARWTHLPLDMRTPATDAFRTATPVVLERREDVAERYPHLLPAFDAEGLVGSVALPLWVEERPIGVLTMGLAAPRAFAAEERALLGAFAQQGALAVERSRLYEAERVAHAEAERARAEAERANRAKSDFLAVMSHELRTPLNAIAGHVELLEMGIHGELSGRQLDALGRVARAQRHLLGLINDVLNLSRIESGRVEYAIADVDVRDVMQAVAPLIEPQLASRQLAYEVRLPDAPLVVRADRDKLQQVLLNLLANAAKYTEPGGRVCVDTATRAGAGAVAFVRVRDTGCGIAREKLEQVFEPFVRVDSAHTRRTDGAGLGLAIARDLARGMGGELRARSVLGEGSTFTIALPLA